MLKSVSTYYFHRSKQCRQWGGKTNSLRQNSLDVFMGRDVDAVLGSPWCLTNKQYKWTF